jgi:hypothetical protein
MSDVVRQAALRGKAEAVSETRGRMIAALQARVSELKAENKDLRAALGLGFTQEQRKAIQVAAESFAENDGDPECERVSRVLYGLLGGPEAMGG